MLLNVGPTRVSRTRWCWPRAVPKGLLYVLVWALRGSDAIERDSAGSMIFFFSFFFISRSFGFQIAWERSSPTRDRNTK